MCTLLSCDSDPLVQIDVKSCAVALCPLCFHPKLPAKLAFLPYLLALKLNVTCKVLAALIARDGV